MLEPRITPVASVVPTYYLDQIDVAVELPMGPAGETGPPGTLWIVGPLPGPPTSSDQEVGTLYLGGDGKIYEFTSNGWVYTGVDLSPTAGGSTVPAHDHDEYLRLTGGALTGALSGTDATFTDNVVVPTPDAPEEAVNVEYLDTTITNLNLAKFLGDISGNAISTMGSWNTAEGQAIYQQGSLGQEVPPGVAGATVGLTIRQSNDDYIQLICDLTRNMWFSRKKEAGTFHDWLALTHITNELPPVDGTDIAPNGTIWIQTDSTVTP